MSKKQFDSLLAQFKAEVNAKAKAIDPNGEEDWHSLTLGWAVAKGIEPTAARNFATNVRYKTDLA